MLPKTVTNWINKWAFVQLKEKMLHRRLLQCMVLHVSCRLAYNSTQARSSIMSLSSQPLCPATLPIPAPSNIKESSQVEVSSKYLSFLAAGPGEPLPPW